MAERERAVAFTIPWNCEAGPAKSEELMPWQQFRRPVMSTIRLCGNDIDGDAVSCTGSQLATVFETIAQTDSLLDGVWHAADVDPSPGEPARYGGNVRIPEKATTLSGAWRPRDPVDDDQGGARA